MFSIESVPAPAEFCKNSKNNSMVKIRKKFSKKIDGLVKAYIIIKLFKREYKREKKLPNNLVAFKEI